MKVYHLSSAPFTGGAARAAFRLHLGLMQETRVESTWLDAGGGAIGPNVEILHRPSKSAPLAKRLRRRYWTNIVSREFAPTSPPGSNPIGWGSVEMLKSLPVPDVWNLHWVSWFLDWEKMLPWMAERAPIVWTLHDLNPLSGIWHYEPLIEERTQRRMTMEWRATELKRHALANIPRDRLTFVGPSRWMVECCRNSPITRDFAVEHIPYGLDTEVFSPRDTSAFRSMLGISESATVVGFIADSLTEHRKGGDLLRVALNQIAEDSNPPVLLTVGRGHLDCGNLPHVHLGPLYSDVLLANFYSACDVFVCPSLQDNLPNTVLEALACGTQTVAFAIGGMPDMIVTGQTGVTAPADAGANGLVAATQRALKFPLESKCISELACKRYGLTVQADSYHRLYRRMGAC